MFGRTKQVAPKLDGLFALPSAALTLQTELDLVSSGNAGLCFKAGSGESSITTDDEVMALLNFDDTTGTVKITTDDLGFKWLVVTDPELDGLVTRIHGANTTHGRTRTRSSPALCGLRLRPQDARPATVRCDSSTS